MLLLSLILIPLLGSSRYIGKRKFSQKSICAMNRPENQSLRRIINSLVEKRDELIGEHKDLKEDKETAKAHRLALVKKENNQALSEEETEAISETKRNYPDFFVEEVDKSDSEEETTPEYKERKQVSQVIEYLSEELKTNNVEIKKVIKE